LFPNPRQSVGAGAIAAFSSLHCIRHITSWPAAHWKYMTPHLASEYVKPVAVVR
jgi:hypothetical protein